MALPATNCLESTQELDQARGVSLPSASLICVNPRILGEQNEHRVVMLDKPTLTLGRNNENDIVIKASGVSRSHARFYFDGEHWSVEDLKSSNGVMVNKSSLKTAGLNNGDIISVGSVHYKYHLQPKVGKVVSDSEHQVSLFDTESTLVLDREQVEMAVEDRQPSPLELPVDDNKQANITVAVALGAVVIFTVLITVFA